MNRSQIAVAAVGLMLLLLTGCPPQPGGAMNENDNLNVNINGGGGSGSGNGNGGGGNSNASNSNSSNANASNANASNSNASNTNGDPMPAELTLRSLSISEQNGILALAGEFGDTPGEVFINNSARALAGNGWSASSIEVALSPQDEGEVYVQVGNQISNSRWISAWDFVVTRKQISRLQDICGDCFWTMTWRFRMRGDVAPIDFGSGPVGGGTAGPGVTGATFSLDSVTGTFEISGETVMLTQEPASPVYSIGGSGFVLGGGEWFSVFAGVEPDEGRAIISVHVDTDGSRFTNIDTGETNIEHITFFGVFSNPDHINTLVVPLSPSLNIPAGNAGPDEFGSTWEWQAAPVHSPPPTTP